MFTSPGIFKVKFLGDATHPAELWQDAPGFGAAQPVVAASGQKVAVNATTVSIL